MASSDRRKELIESALRRPAGDRAATLDDDAARQALDADLIAMRGDENKAPLPPATS
jgi:hypothetical protein